MLEELSLKSKVSPSLDISLKKQKYPLEDVILKIPTQSLFYMLPNSGYQIYCRCACSTQGYQEHGFAVVAVIACQGQAHLPIQLSCLNVRQAVWLTA